MRAGRAMLILAPPRFRTTNVVLPKSPAGFSRATCAPGGSLTYHSKKRYRYSYEERRSCVRSCSARRHLTPTCNHATRKTATSRLWNRYDARLSFRGFGTSRVSGRSTLCSRKLESPYLLPTANGARVTDNIVPRRRSVPEANPYVRAAFRFASILRETS
jgi:hypothetical protein